MITGFKDISTISMFCVFVVEKFGEKSNPKDMQAFES